MPSFQLRNQMFEVGSADAGLYLVSTPIGNLRDITIRALETLAGCDLVACEDTRVTGKLLHHFSISSKTISYHEHNASKVGQHLVEQLKSGKSVALVSDAGTPLISDPGFPLVESARELGIPVWPIPGATSPVAALVASGLPTDRFFFAGFLPSKQKQRTARFEELKQLHCTLIFFESPNRIGASLADMRDCFGVDCRAVVARELTKLHETFTTGSLTELASTFDLQTVKGEVVVLVDNVGGEHELDPDKLLRELMETMSASKAASEAALLTGLPKRGLYQRATVIKEGK